MPDFQMMAAGYVGFRSRAMARKRGAHILCKCKHLRSQSPHLFKNDGHFLNVLMGRFDAQKAPGQHPGQHFADLGCPAHFPPFRSYLASASALASAYPFARLGDRLRCVVGNNPACCPSRVRPIRGLTNRCPTESGATNMQSLDLITRVGPLTSRPATGPTTNIPFRIEVEMRDGPVLLSLSPTAAPELRGELTQYL